MYLLRRDLLILEGLERSSSVRDRQLRGVRVRLGRARLDVSGEALHPPSRSGYVVPSVGVALGLYMWPVALS